MKYEIVILTFKKFSNREQKADKSLIIFHSTRIEWKWTKGDNDSNWIPFESVEMLFHLLNP